MSDALRPSSLFTSAAPATAPSGVLATLPNPPPEVSQLPAGTTIRGTVIGHDDRGHLLVRTDLGTLAVSTKANLPPGSDVVLQIRSSGAQLHILLMHSDTAAGGGPRGAPQASSGSGAQVPDQLTFGLSIRAVLQAPVTIGTGRAPAPPPGLAGTLEPAVLTALARLTPGSLIVLRITAIDAPAGTPPLATAPSGSAISAAPGVSAPAGGPLVAAAGHPNSLSASQTPAGDGVSVAGGGSPGGGPPNGTKAPPSATVGRPPGAPLPSAGAVGSAQAPSAGPVAVSPAPAGNLVPPGSGASVVGTPAAPPVTVAVPASLRSVASAAGAAYGAAAQQPAGNVPPLGARMGPAAPGFTNPASAPGAAVGNTLVSPTSGASAAGANPGAPSLAGVVTATTNAGNPVLHTPIGTLTLEVRAALPVGSRIVFQLLPEWLPRGPAGLPFESEVLLPSLARAWPEVEEAVRVLHESAVPGVAGGSGGAAIPQPGQRLASALLFFLAALSGGDVNRWLGDRGAQALKDAGRGNLLARLGQDFAQLSRPVESGGGDWRLFLIPMLDGNQVQQIRFFERHGAPQRGGRGDGQDGESTRFILEVEMTRLGDMQLDGLVRERRFDLMLRTRRPLPEAMRTRITDIFNEANEIAGYAGHIGFQTSREWHFMPIAGDVTASAGAGLVI